MKALALFLVCLLISGCATVGRAFNEANKMFTCDLYYGMPRQELYDKCGNVDLGGRGRIVSQVGGVTVIEYARGTILHQFVYLQNGRVVGYLDAGH